MTDKTIPQKISGSPHLDAQLLSRWEEAKDLMDDVRKEMEAFIARCKAAGPPKTEAEADRRLKEADQIEARVKKVQMAIFELTKRD